MSSNPLALFFIYLSILSIKNYGQVVFIGGFSDNL